MVRKLLPLTEVLAVLRGQTVGGLARGRLDADQRAELAMLAGRARGLWAEARDDLDRLGTADPRIAAALEAPAGRLGAEVERLTAESLALSASLGERPAPAASRKAVRAVVSKGAAAAGDPAASRAFFERATRAVKAAAGLAALASDRLDQALIESGARLERRMHLTLVGVGALLLLAFYAAAAVARSVTAAVKTVEARAADWARGDLSQVIDLGPRRDELGRAAAGLNRARAEIGALIAQVARAAREVTAAAEHLSGGAGQSPRPPRRRAARCRPPPPPSRNSPSPRRRSATMPARPTNWPAARRAWPTRAAGSPARPAAA